MTLENIYTILTGITGFSDKVAYRAFPAKSAPALPFIAYIDRGSDNFDADNKVYSPWERVDIELYTEDKDEASEALIETALKNAGLCFEKTDETYIESEQMLENVWEIKFLKG